MKLKMSRFRRSEAHALTDGTDLLEYMRSQDNMTHGAEWERSLEDEAQETSVLPPAVAGPARRNDSGTPALLHAHVDCQTSTQHGRR